MQTNSNFAVFITSHKSPLDCPSLKTLLSHKYSGQYYIVIDDTDTCSDDYVRIYGDHLLIFNKEEYVAKCDTGYSLDKAPRSVVIYARMAVEDFAAQLNLNNFLIMDDDITDFKFRWYDGSKLNTYPVYDINVILQQYIEYQNTGGIACLSFGTGNFYIGGQKILLNMCMNRRTVSNTFLRNTHINFDWVMSWFEDLASSVNCGKLDKLVYTLPFVQVQTKPQYTQSEKNSDAGMALAYKHSNPFERQFGSVMLNPSAVSVVQWRHGKFIATLKSNDTAFTKVISSKYRKE